MVDQLFDLEQSKAVPDNPEKTALVFPYKNQYMLFDGRLGHGVLGSSSKQPRMTMLVNWWAEKPQVHSQADHNLVSKAKQPYVPCSKDEAMKTRYSIYSQISRSRK